MTKATDDTEFAAYFARYRREAVLLHRPYPPHIGRRTNSKFGGLPRLPSHYEWPRSSSDIPLHFLAQVDCADISFATSLPGRGVLFFFGRDDEEQLWNMGQARDDCRVIYARDAFAATPLRAPPDDLPTIGGHRPIEAWREFQRREALGPKTHVEWPIEPIPMPSWPDAFITEQPSLSWTRFIDSVLNRNAEPAESWQEEKARSHRYRKQLERLQNDALIAATGDRSAYDPEDLGRDTRVGTAIFFDEGEGVQPYPHHWIAIHYVARAILSRPARVYGRDPAGEPQLVSIAEEWLEQSQQAGLDVPVPVEQRSAFRDWLTSLGHVHDNIPLPSGVASLVFDSMVATVRSWAGDPVRAILLPPSVYSRLQFRFGTSTPWGPQFSQMLGHAPSAQEPLFPRDPTVCLLNLASDHGLGWMFGDVGNCTFWIRPDDLARRDFSRVWGTIEGG